MSVQQDIADLKNGVYNSRNVGSGNPKGLGNGGAGGTVIGGVPYGPNLDPMLVAIGGAAEYAGQKADQVAADADAVQLDKSDTLAARDAAAGSATLSTKWASQTGAAVAGGEYSSKEHAIGSTTPGGSAKNWATLLGAAVVGGGYSSQEWAVGSFVPAGSSKLWATKTGSKVDGVDYSAKYHALDAKASAQQCQTLVASLAGGPVSSVNTKTGPNVVLTAGDVGAPVFVPAAQVAGTANAITLAPAVAITAYAAGQSFEFVAKVTATAAVSVSVSGLPAVALLDLDGRPVSTVVQANRLLRVVHDGTALRLAGGGSSASSTPSNYSCV